MVIRTSIMLVQYYGCSVYTINAYPVLYQLTSSIWFKRYALLSTSCLVLHLSVFVVIIQIQKFAMRFSAASESQSFMDSVKVKPESHNCTIRFIILIALQTHSFQAQNSCIYPSFLLFLDIYTFCSPGNHETWKE